MPLMLLTAVTTLFMPAQVGPRFGGHFGAGFGTALGYHLAKRAALKPPTSKK